MFAIDGLYPPAQYAWGWLALAFVILAVLIGAAWAIVTMTRPRLQLDDADAPPVPLPTGELLARMRAEYDEVIDDIERRYAAGELAPRDANLALSATVRRYVNEYSGLEAPVLALTDLEQRGVHPALIDAVRRHYYPGVFRHGRTIDPHAGARAARLVVQQWH